MTPPTPPTDLRERLREQIEHAISRCAVDLLETSPGMTWHTQLTATVVTYKRVLGWLAALPVEPETPALAALCQSEGPHGATMCLLPLGHDGPCGWEQGVEPETPPHPRCFNCGHIPTAGALNCPTCATIFEGWVWQPGDPDTCPCNRCVVRRHAAETPTTCAPVHDEIRAERARQDSQWGGPAHDATHHPSDWLRYIEKQMRKCRASNTAEDKRTRFVKIAALAAAAIESMDGKHQPREATR